jgi:oxidase EvaA
MSGRLRHRHDGTLADRMARSAAAADGAVTRCGDFHAWFAACHDAALFRVDRIPFAELDGWSFEDTTGNLVHRSGRFFSIEGLHVTIDGNEARSDWCQPIIRQPEVGILGILVKEFDGVLHWLMQAKMEPGNPNLLQLSPTVQATRSNYTKVHLGADVKYLDYFIGPLRGRVLADVLQPEYGDWFFRKANRNMIVEVSDDVPVEDTFCWLTLGQIAWLLHQDNTINMDSRSVLSCAPPGTADDGDRTDYFTAALVRSLHDDKALHSDVELLSWFTGQRSKFSISAERIPLRDVPDWTREASSIREKNGRWFSVVAVSVHAGNREVSNWAQPLIEPCGQGIVAFVVRAIDGILHVLVQGRTQGGSLDAELAPTLQCIPAERTDAPAAERPPFLDLVLSMGRDRIRYEAIHSEEGGRFLGAQSRYLIVEATENEAPPVPPPGFCWVTPGQLTALVRHGHHVNVQARTLLACLNAMAVPRP